MADLILLRGLPGSGKSAFAALLAGKNGPAFSVDDYFTAADGRYHFEFDKNHLAYKACEDQCRQAMQEGKERIVIHNTFVLDWEIKPYFKLAAEWNYRVFVLTVENYHGRQNQHGVSDEQLQKMAAKYKVKLF